MSTLVITLASVPHADLLRRAAFSSSPTARASSFERKGFAIRLFFEGDHDADQAATIRCYLARQPCGHTASNNQ
jgi:hypothetical protein